jgi:signal transduction histidine kinase/PAS domain-containing protein
MLAASQEPTATTERMLDRAPVGIFVLDARETIVDALGDIEELVGVAPDSLVGHTLRSFLGDAGHDVASAGQGQSLIALIHGHTVELRLVRSPAGHPSHAIVLAVDLEAHTLDDASNRERARQSELLSQQFPGATWATDRALRVTRFLGKVDPGLKIEEAKVIGMPIPGIALTKDPSDPMTAHHLAALEGKSSGAFHDQVGERWYELRVDPQWDESGAIVGCVGSAMDVTDRKEAEERAAASTALLALAQELAHVASWEWDIQRRVLTRSEEFFRICGRSEQEFGTSFESLLSFVHPDDLERTTAILHGALVIPGRFEFDERIVRPDGTTRTLHVSGIVIADDAGVPLRAAAACLDTTGSSELMQRLERTISLLEATIESTADGILVVDRRGKVSAYNKRFLTLWGIPESLAAQRDDAVLIAYVLEQLEDPDQFTRNVERLYATPAAESLDELRFKDGRVYERYSRPQRVENEIIGRVWSFRNVSERTTMLRDAVFLADASRLLATLDAELALEAVAKLAVPALGIGCAVDLFTEGRPHRLFATSRKPVFWPEIELPSAVFAGHSVTYEVGASSRVSVPFMARGRSIGALTLVADNGRAYTHADLDLCEEVARRAALALENARLFRVAQDEARAREEFLGVASHEIRGPLTAIRLAVQALDQKMAPAPRLMAMIEREERRLTRLVDELLDLGKFRTNQIVFASEPVDLIVLVHEVVARMAGPLAKSGSALTLKTEGAIVGNWDSMRLDQVVTNLLSNAIKFGQGNPIEIALGVRDGRALLAITDHGIGIRPELCADIFEPFKRAVPFRHYGGLGFGLYIARTIVEGLGGTIDVRSSPGHGSTFTVHLPIEAPKK